MQFGHCRVPKQYASNFTLGWWVSQQRHHYWLQQEGKPSAMTVERIRALDDVGFDWRANKTDWSARFQQLCKYKAQFANCLVPQRYAANPRLGLWVSKQRRHYRLQKEGKTSDMTAEHSRALQNVGFDWGTTAAL